MKKLRLKTYLSALVLGLSLNAGVAHSAVLQVDKNTDCKDSIGTPYCTIQAAVNDAVNGDEIQIGPGEYFENITITEKGLSFIGSKSEKTIVNGSDLGRVFSFFSNAPFQSSFENIEVTNGLIQGLKGAGIYISNGDLTLNNALVSKNWAVGQNGKGAGVFVENGDLEITNTTFLHNLAGHSCGGFSANNGSLNIINARITLNGAQRSGGFCHTNGDMHMLDTDVIKNNAQKIDLASHGAGGFSHENGLLFIETSTISDNISRSDVGAFYHDKGKVFISFTNIQNNESDFNTGAVLFSNSEVVIENTVFSKNKSRATGCLRAISSYLKFDKVHINENSALESVAGGLSLSDSRLQFKNGTIENNSADSGGGIYSVNSLVELINSTVNDNTATVNGGGIFSYEGSLHALNSTISGNKSDRDYGGIYATHNVSLSNVTLVHNIADADEDNDGQVGGIGVDPTTFIRIKNSIIALNEDSGVSPDCEGLFSSPGNNIIGNSDGCDFFGSPGDLVGTGASPVDPLIEDLNNNLSFNKTHALLPNSPAIDSGQINGCEDRFFTPIEYDQIGLDRHANGDCDIGAIEYNPEYLSDNANVKNKRNRRYRLKKKSNPKKRTSLRKVKRKRMIK